MQKELTYLQVSEKNLEGKKWAFIHSLQKDHLGNVKRLQEILNDIHEIELVCLANDYEGWIAHVKRKPVARHLLALGGQSYAFERIEAMYFYKRVKEAPVYSIREHMKKVRQLG